MATHKILFAVIILIFGFLTLYSYYFLSWRIKLLLIPFMMMTLVYNLDAKWLPINKLRNNGVVKIIVVAVVWSGLVVWVPLFKDIHLNERLVQIFLKFAYIFIYILMLTMSFDQRDLHIDHQNLKTLPQLYKQKLFYFYVVFNTLLSLIALSIFKGNELFLSIFMINLSTFMCLKSTEQKSFYYTAFWIEALPVFWYIARLIII